MGRDERERESKEGRRRGKERTKQSPFLDFREAGGDVEKVSSLSVSITKPTTKGGKEGREEGRRSEVSSTKRKT